MTDKQHILNSPIEYLKGVGPQRGELLRKELNIHSFADLLDHFPYRHVDRTQVGKIKDLNPSVEYMQLAGTIVDMVIVGEKRAKRLVAYLQDETGLIELTWFHGINWVQKSIKPGQQYIVYGKIGFFMGKPQICLLYTSPSPRDCS